MTFNSTYNLEGLQQQTPSTMCKYEFHQSDKSPRVQILNTGQVNAGLATRFQILSYMGSSLSV